MTSTTSEVVLRAEGLNKTFKAQQSFISKSSDPVHAVKDVSLSIKRGETLALVGESGSGKSTVARLLCRLEKADSGDVEVLGIDWAGQTESRLRTHRHDLQMVFQDPYSSLDPMKMVVHLIGEPLKARRQMNRGEVDRIVSNLMMQVGLSPSHIHRYPHEFSGGQRQRIAIARALAAEPAVIIADEAVSALDVSVQAQVLNLLRKLQADRGVAILFITHDLGVVRQVADRVAVMYLGQIVETGSANSVLDDPQHPYTRNLLAAVPEIDPDLRQKRHVLAGEPLSTADREHGCLFRNRCPLAIERCETENPELHSAGQIEVACHVVAHSHRNVEV